MYVMDNHHLWIALCVLMNVAISQASQDISTHTGEKLTIPCPIQLDSAFRVLYWRKDGKTIYYSGENSNGNYSVTDTTSLVISDVSNRDAGNYSCKVVLLSLDTAESDVIEVYVTDLTVSNCSSSQQGTVDDCSCHVDGTNVTSLNCTASGFPHSPTITWTHNGQMVGFASADLKQFEDNVTLICSAWDKNVARVATNKTVCIFYKNDLGQSKPAKLAIPPYAIALIIIILALIIVTIIALLTRYKHGRTKRGQLFHLPIRCPFTSCSGYSKSTGNNMREEWEFQEVHEGMKKDEDDNIIDIPEDDNRGVKAWKEAEKTSPPVERDPVDDDMPLVGSVLLDDLSASNEQSRVALKRAINWLMKKRVQPYKDLKLQSRTSVSLKTSVRSLSMQGSVIMDTSGNRDVAYVTWILKQLDRIRDPTDRDECEILITKPDFQAVTDDSQIPEFTGQMISVCIGENPAMSSVLNRSMPERNELSDVILTELQSKSPQERTATRNAISQIILEFIRKGQGHNSMVDSTEGFVDSNSLLSSYEGLLDEDSRLVALWTSKIAKLDDEVQYSITDYLFTPKSSIPNESSAGLKEEGHNETLKTPSMENLPKDNNERLQID